MKILNKLELRQIAFNHLSDIGYEDFMNYCIKCTTKTYSFLVIDSTINIPIVLYVLERIF